MNIFFKTKLSLEEHNTLHHAIDEHALDGPPFRCKICNKSYKQIRTLYTHNALHHPLNGSEKSYTCNDCDESFHNIIQLKFHRKSHIRIPCPQCKKMFNKQSLKSHLRVHVPNTQRFRCKLCCKEYKQYSGLKWHITLKHEENNDESQKTSYVCEQCNKSFEYKILWQQHRRSHIQRLCYICGKMMGITVIQMHIDNHLVEPLGGYKCELCDKRYTHKCTFLQHIASMHRPANKKPKTQCFRCKQCKKPFKKRKELIANRRIHNSKKCPICEKNVSKPQFKHHMKKHERLVDL
ncbi:zinc finger protein 888-like [Anopheles ziemanni]|uniref:zinc finger protein 888-like n=1 Tax=Anopheles coustani TaxID=139045 RepID=UPI002658D0C9|nr:zinc finger protein 888-like [Anopheles coustani]XP_058175090.1 zinc finger protein 888-like [Anopheles ziemanni]